MSLLQFIRILWARRLVVAICTISAVLAAFVATQVMTPRYRAEARLELSVGTPDPVTDEQIAASFARAYTKTQEKLLDEDIGRRAVDRLGLARVPQLQNSYQESRVRDGVDFQTWLARRILANADARLVEGSSILAISYTAATPAMARDGANALRAAYVEDSTNSRRQAATEFAQWHEVQARVTEQRLATLQRAKAEFERQHGLILQGETDVDTLRLQALASQGATPVATPSAGGYGSSSSASQLAQVETQIAQASRTLGPNHPQMVDMQARRSQLARDVARDRATASVSAGAAARAAGSAAGASEGAYRQQRARVVAQRDELNQLRRMQQGIDVQQAELERIAVRSAELRQQANAPTSHLRLRAAATTPEAPVFPNVPLMLAGAFGFGLGLGVLLALLLELLQRRVRGVEDLTELLGVPLLVVVSSAPEQRLLEAPDTGRLTSS